MRVVQQLQSDRGWLVLATPVPVPVQRKIQSIRLDREWGDGAACWEGQVLLCNNRIYEHRRSELRLR